MSGTQFVTYGLGSQPFGNVPPVALDQNFADATNFPSPAPASSDKRPVRSIVSKIADIASLKDYGAKIDGVTDDTLSIQNALSSTPSYLWSPAGTSILTSALSMPGNLTWIGTGAFTSLLSTKNATSDIITVAGPGALMSGFGFQSSVTKTAGAFFNTNGFADITLTNFQMLGAFRGVLINAGSVINIGGTGAIADIRNSVPATGFGIYITGANNAVNITNITMDAPSGSQPGAGIYADNCGDVIIDSCNIIHQGNDLQISPAAGQVCASICANNTFFDTAVNGVYIAPTGTGAVVRCRFNGCWFGGHSSFGFDINCPGTASVAGVHLVDPHIISCTNNGFNIVAAAGVSDISIYGGFISGQLTATGIALPAGMSDFVINGVTIGAGGGLAGNVNGIFLAGAISNCVIANNKILGNSGSSIAGGAVSGSNVRIYNNAGFNPQGYASIAPAASPFTYTAGLTSEVIMINGGTVSLVSINGNSVFQQTNCTVKLSAGETVTVTYTVAPGMAKYRE